jgi:hypothetical protein
MTSEFHPSSSFPFTVSPCLSSFHIMTPTVMNLPTLFHFSNPCGEVPTTWVTRAPVFDEPRRHRLQVHGGPTPIRGPQPMHQLNRISNTKTIVEFHKNLKTLHLTPYFLEVVHKLKYSLKNNDCFYFEKIPIQRLHYQLFSLVLCDVLLYLFFSVL